MSLLLTVAVQAPTPTGIAVIHSIVDPTQGHAPTRVARRDLIITAPACTSVLDVILARKVRRVDGELAKRARFGPVMLETCCANVPLLAQVARLLARVAKTVGAKLDHFELLHLLVTERG